MHNNLTKIQKTPSKTIDRTKDYSHIPSIPLPNELLQYEVLSRLDLPSILSFCTTDQKTKAFCDRYRIIENNLHKVTNLDYSTLQKVILNWVWSGNYLKSFMTLLPSLIDRLDLYTLQIVYLYLLEQEKEDEATTVKDLTFKSAKHSSLARDRNAFAQKRDDYNLVAQFIKKIQTNDMTGIGNRFYQLFYSVRNLFNVGRGTAINVHKYLAELIGESLSEQELESFLHYVTTNNLARNVDQRNFFDHLYYYLFRTNRLTKAMTTDPSSPFFTFAKGFVPPDADGYHRFTLSDGGFDRQITIRAERFSASPDEIKNSALIYIDFTLEGVLDSLDTGRWIKGYPVDLFNVLTPEQYVTIILTHQNKNKLLESAGTVVRLRAYDSGYNLWYENVEKILRARGVKYSDNWGWYLL